MAQNQRSKMCPNCEGSVAYEVSICPYCGNSVFDKNANSASQKTSDNAKSMSYEETLASLYPPPYKPKVMDNDSTFEKEEVSSVAQVKEEVEELPRNNLVPTMLFWIGINILVFSLILLVFSKDGFLYLKWNASFWYLYSLISLPLLYFGFKGLSSIK